MSKLHFRDRSFVIETYRQQIAAYEKLFDFDKYLQADEAGKRKYVQDANKCIANLAIVKVELTFLVSEKRKLAKRDPLKAVQDEAHLEAIRVIMNNLETNLDVARRQIALIASPTEAKPIRIKKARKR